jgi:2-hydroxychromene-2-carboxylate isomerase
VVRDKLPEQFLDAHIALFAARHDQGKKINEEAVVREALESVDVDADAVLAEIAGGGPLETVRREHVEAVERHEVWGVPTFLLGDQAVFIRLMDRPGDDVAHATRSIERILALMEEWPDLNEYKHTSRKR